MKHILHILICSTRAARMGPTIGNGAQQATLDESYCWTQPMKPMCVPS